jgi:luciferase family oxidoreductase group 1
MKLSVLDQSPISEGSSAADALRNTIDLARHAENLGYTRYWVAEHHGMEMLASSAPEVLLARIGAETRHIRIGSGAILLPHYSPFKVAESFRTLHALYPDRIDLGIGRAPGGTQAEARALRKGQNLNIDDFPDKLLELRSFLRGDFPPEHAYGKLRVSPEAPGAPELWLLGSSTWSASAAAKLGLPYAFAHFIDPQFTRAALDLYHAEFEPSPTLTEPRALVALGVICADTNAEAERLAASPRALLRRFRTFPRAGGFVQPPEIASDELSTGLDPIVFETGEWNRYVVGSPEKVRSQLTTMAKELSVDEVMAVTIVYSHSARRRSYELLAEAFSMPATGSAAAKRTA